MHKDGQKLWGDILSQVKSQVSPSNFKTWFAGSHVLEFKNSEDKKLLMVGVKNSFLKEQVEARYKPIISEIKESKGYRDLEVVFVVAQKEVKPVLNKEPLFSGQPQNIIINMRQAEALNPSFTFENFIVGSTNNLAHVASTQVSESLGSNYNPLLIYGPTGVGKTHLLQAIGNKVIDKTIDAKVLYVTSEKFTNDYIQSLNNKTTQMFRQKYRGVDLLLVDDIQFLAGKESTQDEFFNCFNELVLSRRQVVVASDKHPKELGRLKERLVSRFLGGMVVDVGYPDYEMKIAIIKAKCAQKSIKLADDLINYIARESHGGAREIEGVLTSTMAKIKIAGGKFNHEEIKEMVSKNSQASKVALTPGRIFAVVCKRFRIDEDSIKNSSRKARLVKARQLLMYLLRHELGLPLASIGELVGGRDHSTVIHAVDKIAKKINEDKLFNDEVLRITAVIHNF